jgi:type I restriction enzyme M protein
VPDKTNAQLLRTNQTEAEKQLWRQLRNRNLADYKFRRQYPIEPYIVDFLCFSHKLIIELDGGHHNEDNQIIYDKKRSNYLEQKGFFILRFWNNQVLGEMDVVLNEILVSLEASPSPQPSPSGRGSNTS